MDGTPDLPSRTWAWALAIFTAFGFAFIGWHVSNLYGGVGALGLVDQQLVGEVTALRQEVATQRETIEALKASTSKSNSVTPASMPSEGAAPVQTVTPPKANKPRR